jgi:CheY-like chemotaxis protein
MSILYIEDDDLTRETITRRLRRRGLTVVEARSGEEGLAAAAEDPHLTAVLLDVDLPGINGLETYRRLRDMRPRMALVVCSASLPLGTRQPFLDLGISDRFLLTKPCSFSDLMSALQGALPG